MEHGRAIVKNDSGERGIVPALHTSLHIRTGEPKDIGFIDQMQKHFAGALGFLWFAAIEKKLENGECLIAVDDNDLPYGYLMGQDRYSGNDELGIIFQLAVVPIKHRKQVGASLLKHFFHHAPYGMKLCCCWCAQDLPANWFWQQMGFLPIAVRTGSKGKRRIHIFWQRRVRQGDTTTPFWFPKVTTAGAVAADRLIIPLPPGKDWRDEMPVLLPDEPGASTGLLPNGLPDPNATRRLTRNRQLALTGSPSPAERVRQLREQSKHIRRPGKGAIRIMSSRGHRAVSIDDGSIAIPEAKPKRVSKPRPKAKPEHVRACRELRDRYLEEFNRLGITEDGKYDPARNLAEAPSALGKLPSLEEAFEPKQLE